MYRRVNKSKNDQANADPSEDERNYDIDHLNLVYPAYDSGNYSE